MSRGTVKWFNSQKGYGFIQPQKGRKDLFVHISAVEKTGLSGLNECQAAPSTLRPPITIAPSIAETTIVARYPSTMTWPTSGMLKKIAPFTTAGIDLQNRTVDAYREGTPLELRQQPIQRLAPSRRPLPFVC